MPRKKLTPPDVLSETPPVEAPKPTRSRRKAAEEAVLTPSPAVVETVIAEEAAVETGAKPRRRAAKPAPVEDPVAKPSRARKSAGKTVEAPVEKPTRGRKKAVAPVAELELPIAEKQEEQLVLVEEPEIEVEEPVIEKIPAVAEEISEDDDFPMPIWRSTGATPAADATAEAPIGVEPGRRDRRGRGRRESAPVVAEASASVVAVAPPVAEDPEPALAVAEAPAKIDGDDEFPVFFRSRGAKEAPVERRSQAPVEAPLALEPDAPVSTATAEEEFEDVAVSFRPRGSAKPADRSVEAESDEAEVPVEPIAFEDRRDRGRRRERGRDRREEKVEAVQAVTPVEEEADEVEELEQAPQLAVQPRSTTKITPREVRKTITIPADAPQVVVRDGVPTLVRDGRAYPPLFFSGFADVERKVPTVMEEIKLAAEAGVHVHSLVVEMVVAKDGAEETASLAAYLLQQAIAADPEAQVLFRIVFTTPPFWSERYPDARYRTLDGKLAEPSVCDASYWGDAKGNLERFVKMMRLAEGADHIMGLHLERGEWFLPESSGYDDSRAAESAFREWARTRYNGDVVALRASWFDGSADFASLKVPTFQPEGTEGERFVRSSRKQRRYVDYHLFVSDATVARLGELAYAVKAASEGRFLVGVSYGYTFEWSHPASGHLALGKLLRTEEVDFVAGPPSYKSREPGGTAPFPGPIDSFAINGKLYISEEDYKTSLGIGGGEPDDDFNPSLKTPQALESVHMRGAGAALAHGAGVAWMDSWGNGWLRTASVWKRAEMLVKALTLRFGAPLGDPEVAVFIDERSLAYLVDENAFQLLVQNVREAVLRAGVSAAFYLLSDLAHRERFPESKLYLFVNAWDLRPELRAAIKSRLQRDDKVLFWLYSAGLFDSGRDSLDRVREVTGIALKPQPYFSKSGTRLLNRRHPLSEAFANATLEANEQLEPSYFAVPEDGLVLGEYTQTGLPSFIVKQFRDDPKARWTSVFLGEPVVTPNLVRALAQMAGAHVYDFTDDVVHVRAPFLTVHCKGTGHRTIALPDKTSLYDLSIRDFIGLDQSHVRFHALEGSTHNFLVGSRDEIEELLKRDPEDLLRVEALPPRESNVRLDASAFDVPVMSLGEFMSTAQTDEAAEEWFLRPLAEDIEEVEAPAQATESSGEVGRRRRRRGRGKERGDSGPTESTTPTRSSDNDLGMAVVFRKRS